ncbi:MAG: hypothetical protein II062_00180 [Oscillospiraceae bacterium]|nr:hypothetical protein [Oscillospiraceae bacterium]
MPKVNFIPREERRALLEELQRLTERLGPEEASSELFQSCKNALHTVEETMESLCELGPNGLPPILTLERRETLLNQLTAAGAAGEKYLTDARQSGKRLDEGIPGLISKLQPLLALDLTAVSKYNPEEKGYNVLPIIQESARTRTIDLRGRRHGRLGHMQSSRIPITFLGPNGEARSGVFTKTTRVHNKADFLELVERAAAQCDAAGAAALRGILGSMRENAGRLAALGQPMQHLDQRPVTAEDSDDFFLGRLLVELNKKRNKLQKKALQPADVKSWLQTKGIRTDRISKNAMKTLTDGLNQTVNGVAAMLNTYSLELKDGDRLDNRNTAMSAVADLLGAGSLLARSDSMRFLDENGQPVEGTFMNFGKGLDLGAKMERDCRHLNGEPLSNREQKNAALKSIADLQVLDLLCLNVDRHAGNLMYQVDEQGFFKGVEGIDNDSSFGLRDLTVTEMDRMKVMSRSMFDKLQAMTPDMLKFALRGRGLSEAELNAAGKRLETLRGYVRENPEKLRVVEDDAFAELPEEAYKLKAGANQNLFYGALQTVERAARMRVQKKLPFTPYRAKAEGLLEVGATDRKFTVGGAEDLRKRLSLMLRDDANSFRVEDLTNSRGSSGAWERMIDAARGAALVRRELKRTDPDNEAGRDELMVDDPRAAHTLAAYDEAFETLRVNTLAYLQRKQGQRGAASIAELRGKNPYEQARIRYARELLALTEEYQASRKPQRSAEEQREYEDQQGVRQLQDNARERLAALEARRNQEQQGLALQ